MKELDKLFNLYLFDGDGAAAGAGDGAGADSTGANAAAAEPEKLDNPKRLKRNPLADVKYGLQPAEAQQPEQQSAQEAQKPQAADPDAEWKDIRNSRYKQQFDADVQEIVKKRLGSAKDAEARLAAMQPMLDALIKKNGLNDGDYEALSKKVLDDDSLYEDEAMERGMSVETLKQVKALEADNARFREQEQQSIQQQQFQQHIEGLARQGEALKQTYPGFDLRTELQNPDFARLTSPQVGVDVKTAYEVVHHNEIMPAAMQYAVQRTAQQVSNAIRSRGNRPQEGSARRSAAVDVRPDPTKWSRQDREEVIRRVRAGEKIIL